MKKRFYLPILIVLAFLAVPVVKIYIDQEHQLFRFKTLANDHVFDFKHPHEEILFDVDADTSLHAVMFYAKDPKGVIAYYHGQGVNIETKGHIVADIFVPRGYDVMIMDYRGFGKSRGMMTEKDLYDDTLVGYDYLKGRYGEKDIIVYGCSLGTSMATFVASQRSPKMLILESPYFNMIELGCYAKPYLPKWVITLILKYHMRTDLFMNSVTSPVHIFHGTRDRTIPYDFGKKLHNHINDDVASQLITIEDATHSQIITHPLYHKTLDEILE